jgi:hypothetical protein
MCALTLLAEGPLEYGPRRMIDREREDAMRRALQVLAEVGLCQHDQPRPRVNRYIITEAGLAEHVRAGEASSKVVPFSRRRTRAAIEPGPAAR